MGEIVKTATKPTSIFTVYSYTVMHASRVLWTPLLCSISCEATYSVVGNLCTHNDMAVGMDLSTSQAISRHPTNEGK